ncbi:MULTISPECIES: biotin--[acetyl-CoA-carboxylase] ligase [Commensalibacter]|uniref:biotin--[biotin carboxyl-carrier protein] ligase n=2 Tax=Commensalibacter TaxID=1079922 RepID=W7E0W6_9PROT|nr:MULTISPECIES: biotin--[acetyl-CoA-carboxylase] ligase [Commensalibacter]EUK18659.1 biotin--acetyl-CoA-carboxylase ligase [Commensalibacter papalotli (ex Servin-Garciduenas et al. 2014)]CAI3922505.1 Biotin-(acetyl-CoA carboxylase) ligase (BirA2) (PDB:1BIA) (PUBMED:32188788) [Commensalibacter papalotli (ex Botero et al. 2024)]CAI3929913.1 Biotin-(acetyl-CoA carboxylase) ligase (BirA2) (PDB:1BIA) (PUBMED:32188788) [Commensalibacter papalotli (ex Botero et al. 2024)]
MDSSIIWQVEHYHTLPSTNDYCIEQAKLRKKLNLAVLTDFQTAPRGSRGRGWVEPTGNLALSFLYWPSFSIEQVSWVPFIASLALYDAVDELCGSSADLYIKWPNDLVYQNKKIAGILIESYVQYPDILEWLVFGFGLNIHSAPVIEGKELGCLKDFFNKDLPQATEVSEKVREYLTYWIICLIKGKQAFIRESWLQRSLPLDTSLIVNQGNNSYKGKYKGIDNRGFLLLQTQTAIESFSAGELLCLGQSRDK